MYKKLCLSVAMLVCFLALTAMLAGCNETPKPAIPNPVHEVTAKELLDETGLEFAIPEGASDVSYSIIEMEGEKSIAQVQFKKDGVDFCGRMQPGEALNDISGMQYDWASEETVGTAELHYNEGEAGVAIFFNKTDGINCSVSMESGANADALLAALGCIPAFVK